MPKGHYERPATRGHYKTENGELVKRVLYLDKKQYEDIQKVAEKNSVSCSELIRKVINNFLYQMEIDIEK